MTDQISNLTERSFPEICRNDRSLNETKLHVFDKVEEMKKIKFVNCILSLHATKFYEALVNSFCMGKLLMKINISFLLVFENNTFSLDCLWGIFFLGKSEPIKRLKIIYFAHHSPPCKRSYTCVIYHQFHKWAVNSDMQKVDNRYSLPICCKILNYLLLLQWCCFRFGGL